MKSEGLRTVNEASEYFYPKIRHDFGYKKELARKLPKTSGVYLMKNKHGEIIYVGKAKNLNKRVRSYFYYNSKTERQLSLLAEIKTIDHIKTGTEIGAILLESRLIKKYRPAYNVLGKRYRRYPFVHIDYDDEFPTPRIVHKVHPRGFHYGPFSNSADLELLIEVTKDLFGLKQCDYKIQPGKKKSGCFYFEVNRCSGPCSGAISKKDYERRLAAVINAFDGHPEALRGELVRRRETASNKLHFEKAALINRSLDSLERISKLLEGIRDAKANLDFLLLEKLDSTSRIYLIKNGQLISSIDIKGGRKDIAKITGKIVRTYFSQNNHSADLSVEQIENLSLLTGYFHRRPVTKVKIKNLLSDTLNSILPLLKHSSSYTQSLE